VLPVPRARNAARFSVARAAGGGYNGAYRQSHTGGPPLNHRFVLALLPLAVAAPAVRAAEPFALKDGDRVVFVGNTLIEREQRYAYWETAFTSRYPDKNVTFRNLGWSGDTVFGDARAGFGTQKDGFNHLKEHVLSLKPTVIIVGYGGNEAFDGPGGLPKFEKGLNTLLDTFAPVKARIVLLGPPPQEDLGRPLPDPAEQNKNLRLYSDKIRDVAKQRELLFVDLYDLFGEMAKSPAARLTDNGIHLDAQGYYRTVQALDKGFALPDAGWSVELTAKQTDGVQARRATVEKQGARSFKVTAQALPAPPPPADAPAKLAPQTERVLKIVGLTGPHTLFIDGKEIASADVDGWAKGVKIDGDPDVKEAEQLREAIREKNRLYFHRWRPQNETYLFGFRKHEQGKNSVEIPQFDPLVQKQEEEIAKLRVPVAHLYELKKAK
jgi:lysophospholipase L1-like esterase